MQYEKGLITTDDFVTAFTTKYPSISAAQFKKAWNSIILEFPEYRLEFIENLSKIKITNLFYSAIPTRLHIEQVIENMSLNRYERFKSCFDQFYLSHEIHFRKPDASIYEFVLRDK